jgi:AraC-like DNA-binding protein
MAHMTPIRAPIWHQAPSGWRWRTVTGDYWNCWCACRGSCELRLPGRSIAVRPGTCVLIPPRTAVAADHDVRDPVANLAIHGRLAVAEDEALRGQPVQLDPVRLQRLAEDCLAAWSLGRTREYHALVAVLLARLAAAVRAPTAADADAALQQLVLAWQQHPAAAWTVQGSAKRLGLSRSQFVRRFLRSYGSSPRRYLQEVRDDHALRLLRESDLTLDELAAQAGYTDAAHLGRRLRARTGRSPGALRRANR